MIITNTERLRLDMQQAIANNMAEFRATADILCFNKEYIKLLFGMEKLVIEPMDDEMLLNVSISKEMLKLLTNEDKNIAKIGSLLTQANDMMKQSINKEEKEETIDELSNEALNIIDKIDKEKVVVRKITAEEKECDQKIIKKLKEILDIDFNIVETESSFIQEAELNNLTLNDKQILALARITRDFFDNLIILPTYKENGNVDKIKIVLNKSFAN